MRAHIYKIKNDMKSIAEKIRELKKEKFNLDQHNFSYPWYSLQDLKRFWYGKPVRINHKNEIVLVVNSINITDDMIKEQEQNNKTYWICIGNLHYLQYEYRLLSIVYGQFRGKTREQMEPKFNLRDTTINPITRKYVSGKDPVDWAYIQELKKHYLEPIIEGD